MSCLVHTVDRFDSDGWFSCDQVVFRVFLVKLKGTQHLCEKTGFLFPQVVQKH